ncbi:MAG: hypothetical protein ACOCP8_03075 [archaeon]
MNIEEFEFLKNYYNLLKKKSSKNIGKRYLNQIRKLYDDNEISLKTYKILKSSIEIGENIKKDINDKDILLIKDLILMGQEISEEREAQNVAKKLAKKENESISFDSCSGGFSGRRVGGC